MAHSYAHKRQILIYHAMHGRTSIEIQENIFGNRHMAYSTQEISQILSKAGLYHNGEPCSPEEWHIPNGPTYDWMVGYSEDYEKRLR